MTAPKTSKRKAVADLDRIIAEQTAPTADRLAQEASDVAETEASEMPPESEPDERSTEQVAADLVAMRAENATLKAKIAADSKIVKDTMRLQVSAKKAISLYGVRRFPVTFYVEEWARILAWGERIVEFTKEHAGELKFKGDAIAKDAKQTPEAAATNPLAAFTAEQIAALPAETLAALLKATG
jgi:hypothetical protein